MPLKGGSVAPAGDVKFDSLRLRRIGIEVRAGLALATARSTAADTAASTTVLNSVKERGSHGALRSQLSTMNYQLAALARRKPGVFLPEGLESGVVAAENIPLGLS